MANIAATDVTYTMLKQRLLSNSEKSNLVKLVFGNGALTYPAGGIPITGKNMGCPNIIESLKVVGQGTSGYVFNFDPVNVKLVVLQGDNSNVASGPLIEASTVAIAAQTLQVEVIGW
jgi:hypothetical protein